MKTGLMDGETYSYRMDKVLTGDYFYHVKAFKKGTSDVVGDYLLAKDDSCVYRRFSGEDKVELLQGSTDKLLERVEIYALYREVPIDGAGKVFIRVPGNIPFKLKLTSLNESIASVDSEKGQVKGLARGKVDVLTEVEIGGFIKNKKIRFVVMDEQDMEAVEKPQKRQRFSWYRNRYRLGLARSWRRDHWNLTWRKRVSLCDELHEPKFIIRILAK